MNTFVALLLSFLLLYKYGALFVLMFIAAFIPPLPTTTVLLAAGAFASQGYFIFFLSLIVAIGANTAGDCCGYFVARTYGRRALRMLHLETPSYIDRLEQYVRKHPGPTIFLTRFVGTADPLTNVFSGFIGIPFATFLLYDILGNIVSNGSVLYAGYFLGIHWQDFSALFNTLGWILLGLIAIVALGVSIWYRTRQRKKNYSPRDITIHQG